MDRESIKKLKKGDTIYIVDPYGSVPRIRKAYLDVAYENPGEATISCILADSRTKWQAKTPFLTKEEAKEFAVGILKEKIKQAEKILQEFINSPYDD